ncbi:MAG: poly(3-hydroxybutyrate) depolymerase, partial [Thauera sp.]|nr:poly(3-hydroxybutyrate) depolymerase [Thauera sp.]
MKKRPPNLRSLSRTLATLAAATFAPLLPAAPPGPLPALNIAIEDSSVSGISSGGFMSVQMQVAHS